MTRIAIDGNENLVPFTKTGPLITPDASVFAGMIQPSLEQAEPLQVEPLSFEEQPPPPPTPFKPYLEVWKDGKKIAEISRDGALMTPNSFNATSVVAQDGLLSGKELADQRARLVKEQLGPPAEIRSVETPTASSAGSTASGAAGSYLRWLTQNC
ncbi:hypothetical protein [Magnetospirillum sulfuroxidans]|uniref:Uncharacterized protein n=1 Tax=Magnetospirillum sulfuroxidans TaxID=611300 RepID=A0ABS5IE24_9PROT|nr:hypothetical protein [Magnetospirillum sulfuroxidans]MBR9972674.1 hypothetical protein [Magnetospirillum sulfuroxidans]